MERNLRPGAPNPPAIGCNGELTLSNSDASSPTAEICKDILRRSLNVAPDDNITWTDGKHNSYLYHLEETFVTQLHQSKSFLAHCSQHKQRHINIYPKRLNATNASDQFEVVRDDCLEKINWAKGSLDLWGTVEHKKRTISHGLATCSQECSCSGRGPYPRDLCDSEREGSGQNFSDEDDRSTSNLDSHAKKSKNAFR